MAPLHIHKTPYNIDIEVTPNCKILAIGKKMVVTSNEFFWITMKYWAFIYFGFSILFFGNLLFKYFSAAN
jgi:hypothetical protein